MAPRGVITVTGFLLCIILGLLSSAAQGSYSGKGCCTRHNRKPIPFQRIKGYREQTITENCRIEAIIFYTVKKNEVCATRKDEWVRKVLELLSSKLKRMSKASSADGDTQKSGSSSFSGRSGPFVTTPETFPNSTESFY